MDQDTLAWGARTPFYLPSRNDANCDRYVSMASIAKSPETGVKLTFRLNVVVQTGVTGKRDTPLFKVAERRRVNLS